MKWLPLSSTNHRYHRLPSLSLTPTKLYHCDAALPTELPELGRDNGKTEALMIPEKQQF
jgi:hypothetical protein